MAGQRAVKRNVHIYDAKDPDNVLGGLFLTNGVTNTNFHQMIEILFIFETEHSIRHENESTVPKNNDPMKPGKYYISSAEPFSTNDEPVFTRATSMTTGTRTAKFCEAVRARDGKCVITGIVAMDADVGEWFGYHAAHIVPLAFEGHWMAHNFQRWITIDSVKGGSINSVQNGLLLSSQIHELFDNYVLSISPDDNCKIVSFMSDSYNVAGKHLDQDLLNHPCRPADQLLRWHFRQAVLTNMRAAGEPIFEHDFPPGSDMAGQIRLGPKAAERMEFELFDRLSGFIHDES